MPTHSVPCRHLDEADPPDAAMLVELLAAESEVGGPGRASVIGIEVRRDRLALHMAPLPPDERAGAAGLFGMRAEASWCAVAARFGGRARHLERPDVVGEATALVVVDRSAGIASMLRVDGEPVVRSGDGGPGPVAGLIIDGLHRMLGLPTPGEAPSAPLMALGIWSQELIRHTLEHGTTSWADAVAMHPGEPRGPAGRARVDVSVETVVEATLRTEGELSWERLHGRACAGHGPADLDPAEVAWMDPTLYGRWVLGGLPDPELAADTLVAHGNSRTAACVLAVGRAVVDKVGPMPIG